MIQPTLDRVAVRPEKIEQKTKSGIITSTGDKENKNTGTVVAVGPGRYDSNGNLIPMGLKAGDKVVFFDQFDVDGFDTKFNDVVLLEECDIRAIIKD